MKKVTIFKSAILALLACVGIVACNNNSEVVPDEPETYTVQLGWAGEILDVSYEPMATRAATDDLYGIQVYSKPKTAGDETSWSNYAYGLFDDPSNITITLLSGYKYKFEATMIKDGKNRLRLSNDKFGAPFYLSPGASYCTLDNKFNYQSSIYFIRSYIQKGKTELANKGFFNIPNVERYYGELLDYVPDISGVNANIEMKRTSFGAKFIAGGKLAVDGKLEIQIAGAPKMELALTEGEDQISDIFTFYGVADAWAKDDYTEDINVTFNWIRVDDTVLPLDTHSITFKRNTTSVIKINIDKDGNDESLSIEIDESETGTMPDGDEVTINDGVMQ